MTLGMHRDTDRERVELARELDEVGRVVELARRQVQVLGRIAAQREHVLHARFGVPAEDLLELRARVRRAREVGHRRHRRLLVDPHDEVVGAFTRRAACAVGHRDERRLERFEVLQRRFQL